MSADQVAGDADIRSSQSGAIAALKRAAGWEAYQRHNGELPEGFRVYFRRYGKHGGRWRGVDPHGCWVESKNEVAVLDEIWWMVAAYEIDQEVK